jgi:hypothetical protein
MVCDNDHAQQKDEYDAMAERLWVEDLGHRIAQRCRRECDAALHAQIEAAGWSFRPAWSAQVLQPP